MFKDFRPQIAAAYADAVDYSPKLTRGSTQPLAEAWDILARDSVERAAGIRLLLDVTETDEPEPYLRAWEMLADIEGGHFEVSRAYSDHPLWTVEENVAFRIVHDVLGHYSASRVRGWDSRVPDRLDTFAGFDWDGENEACAAHVRLLPAAARTALFTECLGQTAWAITWGFDDLEQKVADLILPLHRLAILGDVPQTIVPQLAAWNAV